MLNISSSFQITESIIILFSVSVFKLLKQVLDL